MDFDLIVIGGGSGGVRGARTAASLGAKVALVEVGRMGGTCVNVGCVPKKLLSFGAHYAHDLRDMAAYGWTVGSVSFDWARMIAAKDQEILRLNNIYRDLLVRAGVTVFEGFGRVVGPHEVSVGDTRLRADKVLVATGGRPWRPAELPGVAWTWTSDDLFALPALPRSIVIVGAGYIACEFASVLSSFGVQVRVLMRNQLPLRGFDEELRHALCTALGQLGVTISMDSPVAIDKTPEGLVVRLASGDVVATDAVLMATGRVPNTAGLGLGEVGVMLDGEGAVVVDEHFRTSVPSIFAVGDVVARLELTPVALAEAMVFAHQQYGSVGRTLSYDNVPTAVFTSPQLATVGLTEAQARDRFPEVDVYASQFRSLKHTITGSPVRSLVKVVVDHLSDRVLGIHVLDEDAAEMVQGFAAAMTAGITKRQLDATLGIHPTVAEELVTLRTARV